MGIFSIPIILRYGIGSHDLINNVLVSPGLSISSGLNSRLGRISGQDSRRGGRKREEGSNII